MGERICVQSCVKDCLRLDSREYFAFLIFLSTLPDLNLKMASFSPRLLVCAALVLFCGSNARAEGLEQAVEYALNQHPSVRAAIAGRDVTAEELHETRSGYFPEISVNAATGRVYGDNSTSRGLTVDRGAGYSWNHEGGVTVRQMIFDGLETPRRVDAAAARREAANIGVIDTRESLALRVATAYIDVLRNRDSVALLQEHARKIADYRKRIKSMVDQGAADESMEVQAHDIQNQLDGALADVEGQMNKALADYAEAVGKVAEGALERPVPDEKLILADVEQAVQAALKSHPALQAAEMQGVASGYDISAERGTLYPGLTGEMSYFKKDIDDVIGGEVVDQRALLRMNWNFSTGGAQIAKIRQSVHRHSESVARAQDMAARLEREIRKAYAEMEASKKRLGVSRDRVSVSADLVSTYEKQFEAAKITLLNLLQAENTHFNARLGMLNADYHHLAAQYTVLANTGHLQDALNVKPAGTHD